MRESIEMPKGIFYTIVTICSLIIMLTSLEILIKAKMQNYLICGYLAVI